MVHFTFTGSSTRVRGTTFEILNGYDQSYSAAANGGPSGTNELTGASYTRSGDAPGATYGELRGGVREATGTTIFTGISFEATPLAGGSRSQIATATGIFRPAGLTFENHSTAAMIAKVRSMFEKLLSGNDVIKVSGSLTEGWGDYRNAPAKARLGSDVIDFTNVSSFTGTITIFGDARTAGAGTVGGNDVMHLDAVFGVTAYGDFMLAGSSVVWGHDTIHGSDENDTIYGDGPNSTGKGGNDVLFGGQGDDKLYGNGGNDRLNGGITGAVSDADQLHGGAGFDYAVYTGGHSMVLIVDLEDPSNNTLFATGDTFISIEGLIGTEDAAGDILLGGGGANTILGRGGADRLYGRAGADTVNGGDGIDILFGNSGRDVLIGGGEEDTFLFETRSDSLPGNPDIIRDFDDDGDDQIDVSALQSGLLVWRGSGAFNAPGQIRIVDVAGPDVVVEVNLVGATTAEFAIRLSNTARASMTPGDFIL